jgi:D-sedoheptulose 7-phosphate isomerase
MPGDRVRDYLSALHRHLSGAAATGREGAAIDLAAAVERAGEIAAAAAKSGGTVFFIGNGGSAAIASHMAVDFGKSGGMKALAFNDAAALTCLGNDLGFAQIFAKPIEMHARPGDVLFAISSSGASADILKGVEAAAQRGCTVVTFSGFSDANPLRRMGHLNFYVGAGAYGFVEVSHLALIHMILDLVMGWRGETGSSATKLATVS